MEVYRRTRVPGLVDPRVIASFDLLSYGDLGLLLDANLINGYNNNDLLDSWSDTSGNSNHATQGDSGKQPLYKTGVLNGLPGVLFDNDNDGLTSPITIYNNTSYTIIIVYNCISDLSGSHRAAQGNSYLIGPYGGYHIINNGGVIQGPAVDSSPVCVTVRCTVGTGTILRVNGTEVGSNGNTTGPDRTLLISGEYGEPLNGHIFKLLVYETPLEIQNIQTIENHYMSEYAL